MRIDPHRHLDATPDQHATALRVVADGATARRIVVWDMHDGEFVVHLEDHARRGNWEIFWEDLIAGADGAAHLANDFMCCDAIPDQLRDQLRQHPIAAHHITAPGCDAWTMGFAHAADPLLIADDHPPVATSLAEALFPA